MPRLLILLLLLNLLVPASLRADQAGRLAPAMGMLLVAAEDMADPRFARSVVLLIDYGPGGAAGLIVNRPTRMTLGEALGHELDLAGNRHPLYYGGPVSSGSVTCLLRGAQPPAAASQVVAGLYLIQVERILIELRRDSGESRVRVFSGYAGWNARQLAGEIARGDWYVLPCDPALLFDTPPERLWELLRRRSGDLWI